MIKEVQTEKKNIDDYKPFLNKEDRQKIDGSVASS
jgi:hypothetical protein